MSQKHGWPVLVRKHFTMSSNNRKFFVIDIKRWHYCAGIILSVFIAFHLLNQLFSLAGPEAHIRLMALIRKVYRHPVVETILLTAVVTQLVTGITMLFGKSRKTPAEKIQVCSGIYLSFFLLFHVGAVLYGRAVHLDTNFYFAAAGLNYFPASLFFIPYYVLAVSAISLHVAAIHYLKTGSKRIACTIGGIGILTSLVIVTGFTTGISFEEMPDAYQHFMLRVMGHT